MVALDTVKKHVTHIVGKLGAANRTEALWSLLHAQALLDGGVGGPYDVAVVEDDRRRLAARRAK